MTGEVVRYDRNTVVAATLFTGLDLSDPSSEEHFLKRLWIHGPRSVNPPMMLNLAGNTLLMTSIRYDVLGLGNAIVDVIARADDAFLLKQAMRKGVDVADRRAARRPDLQRYGPGDRKLRRLGSQHHCRACCELRRAGGLRRPGQGRCARQGVSPRYPRQRALLSIRPPSATMVPPTARCYVLVTPGGERTMHTYLGAAQNLHPRDIDAKAMPSAAITYLEGYLWDPPHDKDAFVARLRPPPIRRKPLGGAERCRMRSASTAIAASSWTCCAWGTVDIILVPTKASCRAFIRPSGLRHRGRGKRCARDVTTRRGDTQRQGLRRDRGPADDRSARLSG